MGYNISHLVKSSLEHRHTYQLQSLLQSGHYYSKNKDYENSRTRYFKALEIISKRGCKGIYNDQLCCEIYMNISYTYENQLESENAEMYCRLADTMIGQIEKQLLKSQDQIHTSKLQDQDHPKNKKSSQSFENNSSMLNNYSLALATLYGKIGSLQKSQHKCSEAISACQRSIAIRSKIIQSEDDLDIANMYSIIGQAYMNMEQFDNALMQFQHSLEIRKQTLRNGYSNLGVADCYENIGQVYYKLKKLHDAMGCHQKSLHIRSKLLGYNSMEVAHTRTQMSKVVWNYYKKKQLEKQKSSDCHR